MAEVSPIRFAPIPLVSGDLIEDDTGTHSVESITVVIACADGHTTSVDLTYRFGGWWAPPDVT